MADDGTVPWRTLRDEAADRLRASGIVASPDVEARWIVEEASGHEGSAFASGLDELVTERGIAHFDRMLTRRLAGEPLQYVLGRWSFRQLDLMVDRRVLIPRPETEQLVDLALEQVDRITAERSGEPVVVADLGTGSGAIGLSIVTERVGTTVWLCDVSADALDVARANLSGVGRPARRASVGEGSWFDALPDELRGNVDVVVANPPYVSDSDDLPVEVAEHEPALALRAGPDGLDSLRTIIDEAPRWVCPERGAVLVELDPRQADLIRDRAAATLGGDATVEADLTGRRRFVVTAW